MTKVPAYANGECPDFARITLASTDAEVAAAVATAGLPDDCPEFAEALEAREQARLKCATPLPLDAAVAQSDRRVLQDLESNDRSVDEAERRLRESRALLAEASAACVRAVAPRGTALPFLAYGALALALAAVTGAILAPTIDELFLVRYLAARPDDPQLASMLVACVIAAGGVFAFCLAQLFTVAFLRGRVGRGGAVLLFLADALFAAGWGVQRFASSVPRPDGGTVTRWDWHPMAISLTALELVTTFVYSLALHALARWLRERAPAADAYRVARGMVMAARRCVKDDERTLERCRTRRTALLDVVAAREAGARRENDRRALAATSVRAAYLVNASKLASEAADDPALDALDAALDRHTAVFQTRLDHETRGDA